MTRKDGIRYKEFKRIDQDFNMEQFDLVVLGGGPGGYVAAIRSAQLGFKTALVEKKHLGGVCLNWGCIPTKALLRGAEIKSILDHDAADFGFQVHYTVDLNRLVERSRQVTKQLTSGIQALLKKNKIPVFWGHGSFENSNTILITGETEQRIQTQRTIIATGASPRTLPNLPDHSRIWTSKEAMQPQFVPKNLLIVGSGAIGVEFASFYQTLGSQVTVVEIQDRILLQEDLEIAQMAQTQFKKKGIEFLTRTTVYQVQSLNPQQLQVTLKELEIVGSPRIFDAMIVAIGVTGNLDSMNLDATLVQVHSGQIQTHRYSQTDDPSILAIGDVAGPPWLAHKASHEGVMAVEALKGLNPDPLSIHRIPACTYSLPQIASLGMTQEKAEEHAKNQGITLKIGRFPYRNNGKALAIGHPEGLVKTIFNEQTGELLGAHLIGSDATELIHSFAFGQTIEATEDDWLRTIFPHPTLSEMIWESVLDSENRSIHS